jgi:hypothetical protein
MSIPLPRPCYPQATEVIHRLHKLSTGYISYPQVVLKLSTGHNIGTLLANAILMPTQGATKVGTDIA